MYCATGGGWQSGICYRTTESINVNDKCDTWNLQARIIYKSKTKRNIKRIPFLNISPFKGWCGGSLAGRKNRIVGKVLFLLEYYIHFPAEMQ